MSHNITNGICECGIGVLAGSPHTASGKTEAQHIKTGQRFNGSTVRAIHKLTLFGKPAVRLFCEDDSVATLSGTAKVRVT